MNGITLRRLTVVGANKPPASVEFRKGLNVISGPSDTGKSFIFECINFVLGSSEKPKEIREGEGYTKVFLELESNNNIYTLERLLDGGNIKLYYGKIKDTLNLSPKILNEQHKAGDLENISGFLLEKCGFPIQAWLKKNQSNNKQSLSFRHLRNYIMVDEVRVITQESPIHSGQYVNITLEKSIFKLLITGIDDSNLVEVDKPEIKKAKLIAKLDMLDELISETQKEISNKNISKNIENINAEMIDFKGELNDLNKEIDKLNNKRKEIWSKINQKESAIIYHNELLKRFNLLEEQYHADIERLKFIEEGSHYFYQLKSIKCPNCGQDLKNDNCTVKEEIDLVTIYDSCSAEINKIELNLKDLEKSKNNLVQDVLRLKEEISSLIREKSEIENEIEANLKPRTQEIQKKLDTLLNAYKIVSEIESLKEKLNTLLSKRENLEKQSKTRNSTKTEGKLEIDNLVNNSEFRKILVDILKKWGFEEINDVNDVIFKIQERKIDFVVSGKERKSYGKGYRGILYSAFVIGLMKYCFEKGLPHPGFIVIDSPVTTFKDKNRNLSQDIDNEELIPIDKQNAFFKDLSENYKDRQIIIFENKEPQINIKEKINYIEFTKDLNNGRYGFFEPLS